MPRKAGSSTGPVRPHPSRGLNRHSPHGGPSGYRIPTEEIPTDQPSSRTRTRPDAQRETLRPPNAARHSPHHDLPERLLAPAASSQPSSGTVRTRSETGRTKKTERYLDPGDPASVLDPDVAAWFNGSFLQKGESKEKGKAPSQVTSALPQMTLNPIPQGQGHPLPLEILCMIFSFRDRNELVDNFDPVFVGMFMDGVCHNMYSRAFMTQAELDQGLRFLTRFLPSADGKRRPDKDVILSFRRGFESRFDPAERSRYVKRLLLGRECELVDVVSIVSLCKEIQELAITSAAFSTLFDPFHPTTLPDNLELTILQDQENPSLQTISLRVTSTLITFLHTIAVNASEARAAADAVDRAKAAAEGRVYAETIHEASPLHRVKKLAFLTTPLPSMPLHLFDHLSHLAVPINSFVTPNNVFVLYPSLIAAVFLFPWDMQSVFQAEEKTVIRQHVFEDRRIFAFIYLCDRQSALRSSHPPEYERWKEAAREPLDFWQRAHAYTLDGAKSMLESLEFHLSDEPLLERYIAYFGSDLAQEPLGKPGLHPPWMPLSVVRQVYIDPALDNLIEVGNMIRHLPDVEKLALSSRRIEQVFQSAGAAGVFYNSHHTIGLTILDRPGAHCALFRITPATMRITHLALMQGAAELPPRRLFAAFPNLSHIALPLNSVTWDFIELTPLVPNLRTIRAILPSGMSAEEFVSWADTFREDVVAPLPVSISFHHQSLGLKNIWGK